jgi:purine-binding chemotaxis protein CheW
MAQHTQDEKVEVSALGEELAGKYLTFMLGDEEYGLAILKVQEIIRMQEVTRVPRTPHYVRGVINLRGKVIPVICLRHKFGMDEVEDTVKTCIVVVQVIKADREIIMGVIIDEVREVLDIAARMIEETPSFGSSIDTEFIQGMGKIGDRVKMLLDIDKILTTEEIETVAKIQQ